jgi:hypothetical protein
MKSSSDHRVAKKFCFKANNTSKGTAETVHAGYGEEATTRFNMFSWYGRFCEGREGDPSRGRSSESRKNVNIDKFRHLLLRNLHLSLQINADELDISKDIVRKIVVEDLKNKERWLAVSTAHTNCRTGGRRCCMTRFDGHGTQWS